MLEPSLIRCSGEVSSAGAVNAADRGIAENAGRLASELFEGYATDSSYGETEIGGQLGFARYRK